MKLVNLKIAGTNSENIETQYRHNVPIQLMHYRLDKSTICKQTR